MKLNRFNIYFGLSLAAVLFFAVTEFNFSKQLTIQTDFVKSQAYVDMLYPPSNVSGSNVTAMPVYFKVHLPNYYDRVFVSFESENPSLSQIYIATITGQQVKLTSLPDGEVELPVPHDTELKYVLTTKDGKLPEPIIVDSLKLRFERDNLDLNGYLQLCLKGIQKLL